MALRKRVGKRPPGTGGAAVDVHESGAPVEVVDPRSGETLDLVDLPAELLEVQAGNSPGMEA